MAMTDPIADLLTRLRNGAQARKEFIDCPWSNVKDRLARVLITEGFLQDASRIDEKGKASLRVWLRYDSNHRPVVSGLKRISRPSLRVYVGAKSISRVRGGMGISILSTPSGILVDRDAIQQNVGGEVICAVW